MKNGNTFKYQCPDVKLRSVSGQYQEHNLMDLRLHSLYGCAERRSDSDGLTASQRAEHSRTYGRFLSLPSVLCCPDHLCHSRSQMPSKKGLYACRSNGLAPLRADGTFPSVVGTWHCYAIQIITCALFTLPPHNHPESRRHKIRRNSMSISRVEPPMETEPQTAVCRVRTGLDGMTDQRRKHP
jgi:hypothetical protein